jgi:membrane-bound ClpP family serine protease
VKLVDVIVEFVTGFGVLAVSVLAVGLMLVVIEMFRSPRRRALGIAGGVLIVAGIVLRMLNGGDTAVLFLLLLSIGTVLLAAHLLILRVQKRRWLYQSLRLALERERERNAGITHTLSREFILGQSGVAVTDINGEGNVVIDGITVLVHAQSYIERGCRVRVRLVENGKVFVEKTDA